MPTVLAVLAEGFEEIELVAPVDLMRRAGIEVTVAALGWNRDVAGRSGITVRTDTTFPAVSNQLFDCLFLPGGPGVSRMRADSRVAELSKRYAGAGRWVAAICAAPIVLHDAGLLAGRRYTAHFSVQDELKEIIAEARTVTDGRLLTSRGAGTAVDFGLLLIEKLVSPEKAAEVAASICA